MSTDIFLPSFDYDTEEEELGGEGLIVPVEHPYGAQYEEITKKRLKEIHYELGLIKLCWPELPTTGLHRCKHLPHSYSHQTNKEKLILWYAENCRRQFHFLHPDRRPQFLAADNECGIQKMVCTTIRPTSVPYPEFSTWQGCAKFVSDHLLYKPLEKPTLLPECLMSPTTVLSIQEGYCFEYSTLLVSFLIGSGYDAYVVSGYATREFCKNDQSMVDCPHLLKELEEPQEEKDTRDIKYQIKPQRDLRSQFLLEMENRERRKKEELEEKAKEAEKRAIEEYERPGLDDLYGVRVHSWVAVLPGKRDITETFFIEPPSGVKFDQSNANYLGIESMWNHTNFWINLQVCSQGCKSLKFDLSDLKCWEHLLPGEPWTSRKTDPSFQVDDNSPELTLQEKHLDMPTSWVSRLNIPLSVYEKRYPHGHKTVNYKKARLELFAPYLQCDGLISRITSFRDYAWEDPEWVYKYYNHREDLLYFSLQNLKKESIVEEFLPGREDSLKEHSYYLAQSHVEHERSMKFYHKARMDGMESIHMEPCHMTQHFKDREDFCYHRHVIFAPRDKTIAEGPKRTVLSLSEKYHRNPTKPADKDVAERVFAVAENRMTLKFHYDKGNVSANILEFTKPPISELGDRLTFNPAMMYIYQVDPLSPAMKNLQLFYILEELLKAEEQSLFLVRSMEDEVHEMLIVRGRESTVPKMKYSIFDTLRNEKAKKAMKQKEQQLQEQSKREVETDVDYLGPYLARLGDPESLSHDEALQMRESCLSDFKQLLVDRANHIQTMFEKESNLLQSKHRWYEDEQDALSRSEEEKYFEFRNRTTFLLHSLEIRLNRHRDLAPQRYLALEACLNADKRLHSGRLSCKKHVDCSVCSASSYVYSQYSTLLLNSYS